MDLKAFIAEAIKNNPVEAQIVRKVIKALTDAGTPVVQVFDGEETEKVKTTQDILDIVFNLDEAWLETESGWVRLTMGNEWDTICDYTLNLEEALKPVNDWIATKW